MTTLCILFMFILYRILDVLAEMYDWCREYFAPRGYTTADRSRRAPVRHLTIVR